MKKTVNHLAYLILSLSIINGIFQEFYAVDPEYYIPMIIFIIGFGLLIIGKYLIKGKQV